MNPEKCIKCNYPTEQDDKHSLFVQNVGPLCEVCFEWQTVLDDVRELGKLLEMFSAAHWGNVKLKEEIDRLKAQRTWEQERERVARYLEGLIEPSLCMTPGAVALAIVRILNGEHWPEGERP